MASRLATLASLAKNCWASCSKPAPRSHSRSSRTLARSFTPCDQWKQPREEPARQSSALSAWFWGKRPLPPSAGAPSPSLRGRAVPRQQGKPRLMPPVNAPRLMSPVSHGCDSRWH